MMNINDNSNEINGNEQDFISNKSDEVKQNIYDQNSQTITVQEDQIPEVTKTSSIPFLEKAQKDRVENLNPKNITFRLHTRAYPLEEPKFLQKVRQTDKYELKSYEVTLLIQILKNEKKIDVMQEDRLKKKFQTLLLQIFDDPKPLRISKITVNKEVYPYQAELLVDFVTKIGKDPFHRVELQPINYKEKGPGNTQFPEYIINYFMAIKEQTTRYPEDFMVLAKLGKGAFGEVELVKYRRNNQIYALKKLKNLNEKDMKAFLSFSDKNYGLNNNIVREILFLKNLRDVHKLKHPNIVDLENFWVQRENEKSYRLYILMSYFGGTEIAANCIFDFFFPNEGKTQPLHLDIGEERGREVIGQVFFQALEVVEFLHRQGHIHRDIKDDNFLIRRREGGIEDGYDVPFFIDIALCDFGLTGYINKTCSLPQYNGNRYRDTENISKYPAACDIFSLGELMSMLIILYHFYWKQDVEDILSVFKEQYAEELALAKLMKSPIEDRPKNFKELKASTEYRQWISKIPEYIPKIFADQTQFLE